MPKVIRILTAEGCQPCQELKEKMDRGQVIIHGPEDAEVTLHDVGSEEDFPLVEELGAEDLPSAYIESQKCSIEVDGDNLIITCPAEGPTGESSPGETASEPESANSELESGPPPDDSIEDIPSAPGETAPA